MAFTPFAACPPEPCPARSRSSWQGLVEARLGNGWLYPFLSLMVVAAEIERPLRFLAAASLSLLLAFAIYPMLKPSRSRPCDCTTALSAKSCSPPM